LLDWLALLSLSFPSREVEGLRLDPSIPLRPTDLPWLCPQWRKNGIRLDNLAPDNSRADEFVDRKTYLLHMPKQNRGRSSVYEVRVRASGAHGTKIRAIHGGASALEAVTEKDHLGRRQRRRQYLSDHTRPNWQGIVLEYEQSLVYGREQSTVKRAVAEEASNDLGGIRPLPDCRSRPEVGVLTPDSGKPLRHEHVRQRLVQQTEGRPAIAILWQTNDRSS
jgi:hypothetical protein